MTNEEILQKKKSADAVILAHYYVPEDVQAVADYVGDSFYLAKIAAKTQAGTIVFCGVRFMGESAKILNPARRVLLPEESADCPMAHMASAEQIARLRAEVPDLAVVCYINSSAYLKSLVDVCVTSSNAVKIVKSLPNKNILFIPDENLGRWIQKQVPEKNFYFSGGHCPVHSVLTASAVQTQRAAHPDAAVAAHPECRAEVLALADFIGSTAEIIAYARQTQAREIILVTEPGVLYELKKQCPGKVFYPATGVCEDMKSVTLQKTLACLTGGGYEVQVEAPLAEAARRPLERMLELAK